MPGVPPGICFDTQTIIVWTEELRIEFEAWFEELNEEHELELELPGMPPIVFPATEPITLMGAPPREIRQRFEGGAPGSALIGHRFRQGGQVGGLSLDSNVTGGPFVIPGMSGYTVPGMEPWTEIFKWIQTVFELVIEAFETLEDVPAIQQVQVPRSCQELIDTIPIINDNVGPAPPVEPIITPSDPFSQRIAPWAADETTFPGFGGSDQPIRTEFTRTIHVNPGIPLTNETYAYHTFPFAGPNTLNRSGSSITFFSSSSVSSIALSYDLEIQPKSTLTPAQVSALAGPVLPFNNVTMEATDFRVAFFGGSGSFPDGTMSKFQLVFHTYDVDGVFLAEQIFNVPFDKLAGGDSVEFFRSGSGSLTTTGLTLGGKLALMGWRMAGSITGGSSSQESILLATDIREIHSVA